MQFLLDENKKFNFNIIGQGKTIILIPGLGVTKAIWNNLASKLIHDFLIITYDNKGVGTNNLYDAPTTTDAMAKSVLKIIQHLKLKQVCVVGHSLGSYVAQHVAAKIPDIVKHLVLISTRHKSSINSILHYQTVLQLINFGIPREVLIQDSLSWLYGSTYLKDFANCTEIINKQGLTPPPISLKNFSNQINCAATHDATPFLKKITSRTLIINGEDDLICTPKEAKILQNVIKNSELKIIKNLGHMIPIERPDFISTIIKKFY